MTYTSSPLHLMISFGYCLLPIIITIPPLVAAQHTALCKLNKIYHHNCPHMSSSRSGKMLEVNPPKYPTPFNQQATNRVLKQLQIQVMDVEAIILKLKNSLGINKNASERLEISPINTSEVDLSMSSQAGESIVQVELTYSDTPGTKSRMMSEYIQTRPANLSPPRNILKKLVYEQSESIVEQDKE